MSPKINLLASALGLWAALASLAQAEVVYTVKNPAVSFTLFTYDSPTFITTDTVVPVANLAFANPVSTITSVHFIPFSSSLTHPGTSELVVFGEPEGTAFRYYPLGTFTRLGITPGEMGSFGFPNSELVVTATFPSVAITQNQFATSAAIQALAAGHPIFNAVVGQSAPGALQAFDALSGEVHASAVTAGFEDSRLPREAILDHLNQPAEQPVLGSATTMTGTYAADLPSHKAALASVAVQMVQPRLFGLWGQGFGDWGTTDGGHNAAKLSSNTGGFIIGADAERQLFNGDWRFGIAGGYTDDSLKVSARSSSGDYQSIFGALYGKTSYGAIDLKVGVMLASTDTHTSRSIIFPGFADTASSSYGGYAAQGFGEIGYNLPFYWTPWSYVPGLEGLKVNYEPFLQGAVIHIDQNRYVETALTGAALVGASKGYDLGTTTLGWRTQYQLARLPDFTLSTLVGWRHAFGDVIPKVNQTFAGSFPSFTVAGVPVDRDAFVSEASLDYRLTNAVTVGLSYSGQYGRRASNNAIKGHVDVSFW
ncbi:MAG: autotransporter domain-containing protein [Acidobacteriaceae bacterium]|nr:autotransporter domain-containing protein [Acidobacteriaceae bacterium]